MKLAIDTPCIGICSTVYGDEVCRGCKRRYQEVIHWNGYTEAEKHIIFQRLAEHIARILAGYIIIQDEALLRSNVARLQLRIRESVSVSEMAFHLLRLQASTIADLRHYGLTAQPAYQHLSVPALFNEIDAALYALAQSCG